MCGCVVVHLDFAGVLESMHALRCAAEGGALDFTFTSLLCLGGSTAVHIDDIGFLCGLRKGHDGHSGQMQKDADSESSSIRLTCSL